MLNTINQTKEMNNKHITDALEVTISLYESIDPYRLPSDTKIKYDALGQCLRSLMEVLPDEHRLVS